KIVMALSTTSSSASAPRRATVDGSDFCAVVCALSVGVHGALVILYISESMAMAAAFLIATLVLGVAVLAQAMGPIFGVSVVVAVLLLTVALAYLLSRTIGIPGLTEDPELFDTFGIAVSLLEAGAAVVATRQLKSRRS